MDKPLDENADLELQQLASMNPGTAIPVAPHPTTNRFPWPAVDNPTVTAPVAPLAPELPPAQPPQPPAQPLPPPVEEPAGPVATAPIVAYDADLDEHTTAHAAPAAQPTAAVPAAAQTIPPSAQAQPHPVSAAPAPPVNAVPHHDPPQHRATHHAPSKSVRPVKVFSNETRKVWHAQRFQRRYKYIVLFMIIILVAILGVVWLSLGSPTNLERLIEPITS